jgi:hypothetical protein
MDLVYLFLVLVDNHCYVPGVQLIDSCVRTPVLIPIAAISAYVCFQWMTRTTVDSVRGSQISCNREIGLLRSIPTFYDLHLKPN